MRILHTADWHVGRQLRGRSRVDEHRAVLAEIAHAAGEHEVDLVLVVGDLFDTAAPTAESERIVYRALLDLAATGATVVVVAGNHDSFRRLDAVAPLLALGRVVTRPVFARPDDGGVVEIRSRDGRSNTLVACLPFLSQRYVVQADDLMAGDAADHNLAYGERIRRLVASLTAGFGADTVNLVAAHAMVTGGLLGGGERLAHTIFEYAVPAAAFPPTANYVALGHLHRQQPIAGPCPIHYCGSPLQLDFGEGANDPGVLLVDAAPGRPARVTPLPLRAGRRLRTLAGTMSELASQAGAAETGDDWLRVVVRERIRLGLVDCVRELFPHCVDILIEPPDAGGAQGAPAVTRAGRSPHDLFAAYLADQDIDDVRLLAGFDELLDDVGTAVT
ncbi:MAG: exonuclease SbcCD subunit D [Acidimicrobiales bacterium]